MSRRSSYPMPSRTADRPPDPPFGYGDVRVVATDKKTLVAYCESAATEPGDLMKSVWNPVTREWCEWYLVF